MRSTLRGFLPLAPALAGCLGPQDHHAADLPMPLSARLAEMSRAAPLVVAHRGVSSSHPENTLPAFQAALDLGVELVEFDVRQTDDGVLVCLHDETLDRTSDAGQVLGRPGVEVATVTAAELTPLDAGSWKDKRFAGVRLPTLSDSLRMMARHTVPMIEHKAGDPVRYVTLLREMGLVEQVVLQSFDWDFLREVRDLEPRLLLGALGPTDKHKVPDAAALVEARELGAWMLHWGAEDLDPESVARMGQAGFWTCCYTVDAPAELERMLALGLDAITTNVPGELQRILTTRGGR